MSQNELWHRLIKEYQDKGLLVEGPLSNLRKNDMHLSKPVKMRNKKNPGAHFTTQAMYSAKDALMPPSMATVQEPYAMHDPGSRRERQEEDRQRKRQRGRDGRRREGESTGIRVTIWYFLRCSLSPVPRRLLPIA